MATIPVTQEDAVTEAREHTAQRLERLARLVRSNTTASIAELDEAYAAIVQFAGQLRPLLMHK